MNHAHTRTIIAMAMFLVTIPTLAAPDSGQTSRELQQHLGAPAQSLPAPAPEPPMQAPSTAQEDHTPIMVSAFELRGNHEIPTATLQALLADLSGQLTTLGGLEQAAQRITRHYREAGYAVARAHVPAQEIRDGIVRLEILEGRLERLVIHNRSRVQDSQVRELIAGIDEGHPVRTAQVERSLRLLRETPGVSQARSVLQPGISVGGSEMVVDLDADAPYSGSLTLDNQGNRYTGRWRTSINVNLNSPWELGEQLSIDALVSDADLRHARVGWHRPLGGGGLRAGLAYHETRYQLGHEFAALAAHGSADGLSAFASYPLIRSSSTSVNALTIAEAKHLHDAVDSTATAVDRRIRSLTVGVSGARRDAMVGGGLSQGSIAWTFGVLDIASPATRALDAASARTQGAYSRLAYSVSRQQSVPGSNLLVASISGQLASRNLDSSEKMVLGGANAVRAYPQGEAVGDEGSVVSLELRHEYGNGVQVSVFHDLGRIRVNHTQFGAPGSNTRSLSGAGIGLCVPWERALLKFSLAWRLHGGPPTSVPPGTAESKSPTFWFQTSFPF